MRERAKYVYEYGGEQPYSFEEIEDAHSHHVCVHTDDLYLLARVVDSQWCKEDLLNPRRSVIELTQHRSAWFIYLAVGSIDQIMKHEPFRIDTVMWQGHNRIWKTTTERFIKHAKNYGRTSKTKEAANRIS